MKTLIEWEKSFHKKVGKTYYHNIKLFVNTANFEVQKASYSDIVNYISILRKSNLSARNIKNHLSAIKFYYNCLLDLEVIDKHPCKGLLLQDKVDKSINIEILFTPKELEYFLEREDHSLKKFKRRNKVIRQLLVYQALRLEELINLKVEDIDLEKGTVQINNTRTLALHAKQIWTLHHYMSTDRKAIKSEIETDLLVFTKSGHQLLLNYTNQAINYKFTKKFTPLKIRQSVISNLLKQGQDLRKVQLFAGHKYISSTEKYLTTKFIELKSELEKKHPLL